MGRSRKELKFYAVANGRLTGVFQTWEECSDQVHGYPGARFKSFPTRAAAEAFVGCRASSDGLQPLPCAARGPPRPRPPPRPSVSQASALCETQTQSRTFAIADYDRARHERSSASRSGSTRTAPQCGGAAASGGQQTVYVDGSCKGPASDRRAGYGVFFGHGDARNAAGPVPTGRMTNGRGELMGIIAAMETPSLGDAKIYCDSSYVVKGATEWLQNWKNRGFKRADQGDVANQDLWRRVDAAMTARTRAGHSTTFEWVKGHSSSEGNAMADRLANEGADMVLGAKRSRDCDDADSHAQSKRLRNV